MHILKAKTFKDPLEYIRFSGYYFTKDLTFQRLVDDDKYPDDVLLITEGYTYNHFVTYDEFYRYFDIVKAITFHDNISNRVITIKGNRIGKIIKHTDNERIQQGLPQYELFTIDNRVYHFDEIIDNK